MIEDKQGARNLKFLMDTDCIIIKVWRQLRSHSSPSFFHSVVLGISSFYVDKNRA